MAWMVALKKFPYGGVMHEPGQRFYMPDKEYIYNQEGDGTQYRKLFIQEGKAMEDETLNKPPVRAVEETPPWEKVEAKLGIVRELRATEDEDEAKPMTTDDADDLLEPKGRYARRDMRPRR